MRNLTLAACALSAACSCGAATSTVVDIPTRGVTQRILYLRPDVPVANVILMAGGGNTLGIKADGSITSATATCAPTVRNRDAFAAHGYAVAALDAASDGIFAGYDDLVEVIRYMQRLAPVPTWIMSVSSSTQPAIDFAGHVPMPQGLGLVLVSPDRIDAGLTAKVTAASFVVYHQLDGDQFAYPMYSGLVNADTRDVLGMTGGNDQGCAGYHTLNGLDGPFTSAVFEFIDRVNPALRFVSLDNTTAEAVEFYNAELDHYFISHIAAEIAKLDAGTTIKGWTRTGQSFNVYVSTGAATSPVCRFYIPPGKGDSHFYGRGSAECDATQAANPTFVNEDPQFFHVILPSLGVCPVATRNVYRVFSGRADANHRYMVDSGIRATMVARGWTAEGDGDDLVVMCAPA